MTLRQNPSVCQPKLELGLILLPIRPGTQQLKKNSPVDALTAWRPAEPVLRMPRAKGATSRLTFHIRGQQACLTAEAPRLKARSPQKKPCSAGAQTSSGSV